MKKIIIIICTIFLLIIVLLSVKYFISPKYITEEEAKEIAINDISGRYNNYTFNSVEFKKEDNNYIYQLDFQDNINIYIYKINAKNKKILFSKKELLINNISYMNEEDILDIVFSHANLDKKTCNVIFNTVDFEDGIPIYSTTFYHNNIRYDYKTNGFTGSIISVIKINE